MPGWMKNSLKRIQAWRFRRQQRSLERWERIRADGKKWFVFRTALTYGFLVVGVTDVFDQVFDGRSSISIFKLIFYVLIGIVIGADVWSDKEAKYQDALYEGRVKALPKSNSPVSRAQP